MTPERWRQIDELYHAACERGRDALAGADEAVRRARRTLPAVFQLTRAEDPPADRHSFAHVRRQS
jgi:hypothetical protein